MSADTLVEVLVYVLRFHLLRRCPRPDPDDRRRTVLVEGRRRDQRNVLHLRQRRRQLVDRFRLALVYAESQQNGAVGPRPKAARQKVISPTRAEGLWAVPRVRTAEAHVPCRQRQYEEHGQRQNKPQQRGALDHAAQPG